jgi:predicted porin
MRKILLSTSAMIGLTFAIGNINDSVAKNPNNPDLTISGKTNVSTYYLKNYVEYKSLENVDKKVKIKERTEENINKDHPITTRVEDSKIKFDVKGSTEAFGGLDYKLLIALSGDTNKPSVSETAITLESQSYGTISLGDTLGPDSKRESAQSIIGGLGGFYGNLKDIIAIPKEVVWECILGGSPGKSTKIIYTSPRIEGLQLSASLTPNTQQKGTKKLTTAQKFKDKPFDYNNIVGLLSYKSNLNGIDVGVSFTGVYGVETASSKQDTYNQSNSWAIGGKIGYDGWEIGAEYIDNMKSHGNEVNYPSMTNAGKIVNIGVSYTFGQSKVSFGLLNTNKQLGKTPDIKLDYYTDKMFLEAGDDVDNKSSGKVFSLTYDYKLANGLTLFAEANHFDLTSTRSLEHRNQISNNKTLKSSPEKAPDTPFKSSGHALIVGTKFKF